jgi:hypothetical protein
MRYIQIVALFVFSIGVYGQSYMNEWIDHSKTYYRFKVGAKGVYRIPKSQLTTLGIGATDAAHFQIWNKGQEVPIYTSVANGALPDDGFIEFWGQTNDGSWESRLYLRPEFQINPEYSLFTDTSIYFLTINTQGNNKRLVNVANDINSTLAAEPFFMHRAILNFRNQYSQGFAAVVGSEVFSSSYDNGEGFVSANITPASPFSNTINNLFVASSSGVDAGIRYTAAGRSLNVRNINIAVNNTVLEEREMNYFNSVNNNTYVPVPLSLLASNAAKIDVRNLSTVTSDRMVVGVLDLRYPRLFNFGGQAFFEFELPASDAGNKLVIQNFNFGGTPAVLYDLTNGLRITAQITTGNNLLVVLPPSAVSRKLVLASAASNQLRAVAEITPRTFIDYKQAQFQGNYIIISNPLIYNDNSGVNQVEAYGQYRMSNAGGNYKVMIADINQLIDQFGWGIKNNPLSVKNFLRFARNNFTDQEQYCLLVGKGVSPNLARINESRRAVNILNLIPTFGVPCSDVTLAAEDGDVVPRTHIGRLNVINADEIKEYLDKLKLYDEKQRNKTCSIDDELWKKQVMHIGGANDFLGEQIMYYLSQYKKMAEDTLLGANIYTLQKSASTNIQVLAGERVRQLFTEGFSLMTYFGHSSAGSLEFNLDNPENYPYSGKFPVFLVNGCNAGNLFLFDSLRLNGSFVLSEKYVVSTPLRGAIAFIASTHLGIVNYLNLYTEEFYHQLTQASYGKSLGVIMSKLTDTLISRYTINDFFVRQHVEQITLHGDPALVMYHYEKPDYAIENKNVKISPEFISIAENNYSAKVVINNIGRVTRDSIFVRIEKIRPDNKRDTLFNKNLVYISNTDSLALQIELSPQDDKGLNKIIVTLDPDNLIDEMCETNNQVTKEYFIYEDEIRPIYPYDYSIINKQTNLTFYASTANPLGQQRDYYFQIDTTLLFNSSLLKEQSVNAAGGLVEFRPSVTLQENYVYYWRVGVRDNVTNNIVWNNHSFIYRSNLSVGYNQSHYYQFTNNSFNDIVLDPLSRQLSFKNVTRKLKIKTGLHPYFNSLTNEVFMDLQKVDGWRCQFNVFSIYVFEPKTFIPWSNTLVGSGGRYGSLSPYCNQNNRNFFEYFMTDRTNRNNARLLLEDIVPDSALVLVINQGTGVGSFAAANTSFINQWMNDTTFYGSGKSIYHTLLNNGFTQVDSFKRNLPFAFLYKKGDPQFVRQFIGEKENDYIDVVLDIPAQLVNGDVETPWLGPMKKWDHFYWDGDYPDGKTAKDSIFFQLIGRRNDGSQEVLKNVYNAKDTTISFIDAAEYPFLKMKMHTQDSIKLTPFQLDYWRLTGTHVPEGAIAPSIKFNCPDTIDFGQNLDFSIAFKNISEYAFDSLKLKLVLTNNQNVPLEIPLPKKRPLIAGDTIIVRHFVDTKAYNLSGMQSLFLMVNPDKDQPEQHTFNNFLYKNVFVNKDNEAPWLDVTFDGVHILNKDIVSAKPAIAIKIKDNNKFLPILDQDSVQLSIRFPDQRVVQYTLGSDSARYTASSLSAGINEVLIDLLPSLYLDGEYELTVAAKSGSVEEEKLFKTYKVNFTVINKPMISDMFNYPNPFTSSTAFVFTLTGSEVPQNLRIQILTISGKIVREITKNELGTIRIGRNITEYKWDGTDQYGNALANGVYLYRVITNLNGKKLDRYEEADNKTDKFFNNGYGKMYLMR